MCIRDRSWRTPLIEWYAKLDFGSTGWRVDHLHGPAEVDDPALHALEHSDLAFGLEPDLVVVEAPAVVRHRDHHETVVFLSEDRHAGGIGMTSCVLEGLARRGGKLRYDMGVECQGSNRANGYRGRVHGSRLGFERVPQGRTSGRHVLWLAKDQTPQLDLLPARDIRKVRDLRGRHGRGLCELAPLLVHQSQSLQNRVVDLARQRFPFGQAPRSLLLYEQRVGGSSQRLAGFDQHPRHQAQGGPADEVEAVSYTHLTLPTIYSV